MGVEIFSSALDYQHWVNHYLNVPIEIISTIVLNDEIVVTYKRK